MTFNELVTDVMSRLNLTSTDARTRISQRLNDRYRRVTSSLSLNTSRRTTKDLTLDGSTDTYLPNVLIDGIEKVTKIYLVESDSTRIRMLDHVTFDEIDNINTSDTLPRAWAVKRMLSEQVQIVLDAFPSDDTFILHIEGYDIADILADDAEPRFPGDFHDILIEGAMSDELRKMEKPDLASIAETNYERRLSDLRMFIAKSAYMDLYQSKNRPTRFAGRLYNHSPWD